MTDYDDIRAAATKAEADDATEDAAYQAQIDSLNNQLTTVQAAFDAYKAAHPDTTPPPPLPPPTTKPLIGVYMAGNNSGLDGLTGSWPTQPNTAEWYLNWGSGASITIPSAVGTYSKQGRFSHLTFNTRIASGSYVTWNDVAAGKYDARIIDLIKRLDAYGVRMMLSLECEPDNQWDIQSRTGAANSPMKQGQTPEQYVTAGNHVADLIHANSKHVDSAVHLSGWRGADMNKRFLLAKDKLDNVGWDPYKNTGHAVTQTPADLFSTFINQTLLPNGYTTVRRHITETGIQVPSATVGGFTSQQQKDFWNAVPAAMKTLNIQSVTFFRDNSGGKDYVPTDPSVDAAFRDMLAASVG